MFQRSFNNSHNGKWNYRHQGKKKCSQSNLFQEDFISDSKERITISSCAGKKINFAKLASNYTNSRKTETLLQGLGGSDWRSGYVNCCRKKDHPILRFQLRFDVLNLV